MWLVSEEASCFFQNLEWEAINRPRWMEEARQDCCLLKTGGGCCVEAFLSTGKPFHFKEAGSVSKTNQHNARKIETDRPLGKISLRNNSPEVRKELGAESDLRLFRGGGAGGAHSNRAMAWQIKVEESTHKMNRPQEANI